MKLKFVACLICLLLIVAAVDSLPDPPATNPSNRDSGAISALHMQGPATLLGKERVPAAWLLSIASLQWVSFRLDFENGPVRLCF